MLIIKEVLKQGLFDTKYQTFDKRGLSKKIAKQSNRSFCERSEAKTRFILVARPKSLIHKVNQ